MINLFAEVQFELRHPHQRYLDIFMEWVALWHGRIRDIQTRSPYVAFLIPVDKYKTIWGHNPRVGEDEVPENMAWVYTVFVLGIKAI